MLIVDLKMDSHALVDIILRSFALYRIHLHSQA